ncbi:MAG: aminopeptidase P family protein [Scytolyngbya sp. HA4215-MV1]|jgi:Xaa-Pro aminopeptidase|nr:aminopeptidase P family protein [Scytolyngbya sp. HA4215-MV1]
MTLTDLAISETHSQSTQAKLAALRSRMAAHQLDAYLIPSADEHLNEYVPEAKQHRTWISGFTGSAGDFLVGQDQSWLFVDFRYHEQVDLQVDLTLIQPVKLGLDGHKTLTERLEELGQTARGAFRLGLDPFTLSVTQFRELRDQLQPSGVVLVPLLDNLVAQVRQQLSQPEAAIPYGESPVFSVPDALTGESCQQKLERVREAMQKKRANLLPVTKLDQIAWLLNWRGWDISYNPVFIAYAILTLEEAYLFTNLERIDPTLQASVSQQLKLLPYEHYAETLQHLVTQLQAPAILLDLGMTTMGTYQLLEPLVLAGSAKFIEAKNPIEGMKARKNAIEIAQMQQANLRASRAKTRTLKWLSDQFTQGITLTELDVAKQIEGFYAEESGFQGLSFNTIAATGANSSIVHYGTPSALGSLQTGQFLLLDSGAQYLSGTTDDTRTAIVGDPTSEQIDRYTAVLKAHINCAMQRFPKGATGVQLDGIARASMWHSELDYGHGTGHGVGAFLNVHEGPNGISRRSQQALEPGMITSIEPGFYRSGWGGIRLENLYVVKELTTKNDPASETNATPWYGFESLTYIPFDKRLIDLAELDVRQRQWLETYYAQVIEKLSPTLSLDEASWLREVCSF